MAANFSGGARGFCLAACGLVLYACAHTGEISAPKAQKASVLCETEAVVISTGFIGAGQHGCAITADGPVLTVWPEASTAGPINPSPWYAFEADIRTDDPVTLRLDYAGYWHRYQPWISRDNGETWLELPESAVSVGEEGHIATIKLPDGKDHLLVAGRPLITPADMDEWSLSLSERFDMEMVSYGKSLDGRPLEALAIGPKTAGRIVVALTGQHPPEQTGVATFRIFAETLMAESPASILADTRFILLPLANPDGRARGHWRHNNGGLDLNRDWLNQTQPAVRAAAQFIAGEAEGREMIAFMDFHSTHKTLVYTQPFEENYADMSFPKALKQAFDAGLEPRPEWISGHNAGAGTSKNWALQTQNVAGLTIELADDASTDEIESVGQLTARTVLDVLSNTSASPRGE